MAAEGVRLRPAADDADAAFIVEQMVASALEFAPDQPFGIAETVRRPETALRWMGRSFAGIFAALAARLALERA